MGGFFNCLPSITLSNIYETIFFFSFFFSLIAATLEQYQNGTDSPIRLLSSVLTGQGAFFIPD